MRFSDLRAQGKQVKLFEAFLDAHERDDEVLSEAGYDYDSLLEAINNGYEVEERLLEAGNSSDFATYLDDKVTKRLMWGYADQPSAFRTYSRTYTVPDFKPLSFVRLTEMQELLEVDEDDEYIDSQIEQIVGPSMTVRTLGRLFSISRKAIINDDLNQLRDRPAAFGRAAARTLGHDAVNSLAANLDTYDGNALISDTHDNILSGSDAFLSEDALAQAITMLSLQTDPNENVIGLEPAHLIVPKALALIATRIVASTTVPEPQQGLDPTTPVAGYWSTQQFGRGNWPISQVAPPPTAEAYLTDGSDWYVFADQNEAPVIGVGYLNGDETPDVFLKDPGMRNVLGGSDPYSMEFDRIVWKVRHDWGVVVLDWRGIVGALVD